MEKIRKYILKIIQLAKGAETRLTKAKKKNKRPSKIPEKKRRDYYFQGKKQDNPCNSKT